MENEEKSLETKLSQICVNTSEKMSVLESRDKLLRLKRHKQTDLATAVAVVGTCPDMCPEYERYFRSETNQVAGLEMNDERVVDENRMIKEYRRSGADQEEPLPHELRPAHVLKRTMDYLCINIMDIEPNGEWYDFVWSRTRSIRKDITQQHLCDLSAVDLTEICLRFHIHCAATLCDQNINDFDPKINEENLSNCLQSLKDFYYDLSLRGIYCRNEAEFRSYEILLHLNDTGILRDVKNYRKEIRDSPQVVFAIQSFYSYQSNNYIKFFKLSKQSDYLTACVMHRYFNHVRHQAFKIMRKSYTSNSSSIQEYPKKLLFNNLGFTSDYDLMEFCDHIGLECNDSVIYLVRGQNDLSRIKIKRSVNLVDNKRSCSVGQIINGCPLPVNPYNTIAVHNSFDSDGRLKPDAFEALDQNNDPNYFNKSSTNAVISNHKESDIKPIFGTAMFAKQLFNPQKANASPLFTKAAKQSTEPLNTSFNPFVGRESKPNIFSFGNSSQLAQQSSQIAKPQFQFNSAVNSGNNDMSQTPFGSKQQMNHVFPSPQPLISFSKPTVDTDLQITNNICEEIACDLIDLTTNEMVVEISNREFESNRNAKINEMTCILLSDIIINETNDIIYETADQVIKQEIKSRIEDENIIENISNDMSYYITGSVVESEVESIAEEVYIECNEEFIDNQNECMANYMFEESIDCFIEDIAEDVYSAEIDERDNVIEFLRQKRIDKLEEKYFNKWKNWFLKTKRRQYYKESFPAAPHWNSHSPVNQMKVFPQLMLDNSLEQFIEYELLANNFFNQTVNTYIEDIATEVYVTTTEGTDELIETLRQNRINRLVAKCFLKWKSIWFERRKYKMMRKSFPAAPNWAAKPSFGKKIKYFDCDSEPNIEIVVKKFKKDLNSKQSEQSLTNYSSLKNLFDKEINESKALTLKLEEALDQSWKYRRNN